MVRKGIRAKCDLRLVVSILEREVAVLRALLDEEQRLTEGSPRPIHLLGVEGLMADSTLTSE